jgi:hypothetical protein
MKRCACDCGRFAKEGNRFINGHFWKNKKRPDISGKNHPLWSTHLSKETRKKISLAHKGMKFSKEHKRKLSKNHADLSGKNNPNYGKHPSKETRQKMSKSHIGLFIGKNHPLWEKHHSKETKQKMRKAHTGKNNSMYGVHRYGKNSPMWEKHHSKETKQKIGEAHKGLHPSKETREKISKARKGKNNPMWGKKNPNAAKRCIERLKKGYRPSKFEKRIMRLIKQNHLPWKYIGDGREGSFFGKVPDFINTNGQKAFAEAYDDYWHDEDYVPKRRRFFAKFGFKTIFIHYNDKDEKIIKKLDDL